MIKKYLKFFDKGRIDRGTMLYNDNKVKGIKYNNTYNLKVEGNYKDYYDVKIRFEKNDNYNMDCECEDSIYCKHLFASLLYVTNEKCDVLNLNNLKQLELEEILEILIKKDPSILYTILNYQKKNKLSNGDIKNELKDEFEKFEIFFDNFEIEDYNQLIDDKNYDYEYIDEIYEDYDEELIKLLKKYSNKKVINYVKKRITKYNDYLNDIGFMDIFKNTQKYISNQNDYIGLNEIIILFKKDYKKAEIEFEKITDSKDVYKIISKIKFNKKTNLLLIKKIDNYLLKNEIDNYVYDIIKLLVLNIDDVNIKKKYGLILLEHDYSYDVFTKIKSLCSIEQIEKICENILKKNNITTDVFKILYDSKKYDEICEILGNNYLINIDEINNFIRQIIKTKPDKTIELIKKNIKYILDNNKSKYYNIVIEYLKIFKNNVEFNIFEEYKNELLITNSSKKKFNKLYKDALL
jgi:hypothetical protein